jgi:hypothetical protein
MKSISEVPSSDASSPDVGIDAAAHVQFTPSQIADWRRYEAARKNGRYNMFDPRARALTGLSGNRYAFVMQNYSQLRAAAASDTPAYSNTTEAQAK